LEGLNAELFPSEVSLPRTVLGNAGSISDEDLIERAKHARNGDRFRRLWAGDASDYDNDHSRATWHFVAHSRSGAQAIANGLTGYSAVRV
jgi:hypothetical protein